MENRLKLNKRPKYELPDEVIVKLSNLSKNRYTIPPFKPDICLKYTGEAKVSEMLKDTKQIWVKTSNKDLIQFIENYNWGVVAKGVNMKCMPLIDFKRIILEKFYGK